MPSADGQGDRLPDQQRQNLSEFQKQSSIWMNFNEPFPSEQSGLPDVREC
jgi:hypothetical protein